MLNPPMQISDAGLQALIKRECAPPNFTPALVAYNDGRGTWTIGVGHTGPDIKEGTTCTLAQAEAWFRDDCKWAADDINKFVNTQLTQNQFDALVSFVFNLGDGQFEQSSVLRYINAGKLSQVPDRMKLYNESDHVFDQGLANRRVSEAGQWNSGQRVSSASVRPDEPPIISRKTKAAIAYGGSIATIASGGFTALYAQIVGQIQANGGHWSIAIGGALALGLGLLFVGAYHTVQANQAATPTPTPGVPT